MIPDPDLDAMKSISRFRSCVECLLEPLLQERALMPMPCKHQNSFNRRRNWTKQRFDDLGLDEPDDDNDMPQDYCDCAKFDRRMSLWEIGELCLKHGLTRKQMRQLAAVLCHITHSGFTTNHVNRAMRDIWHGRHSAYLKAFDFKQEHGLNFQQAVQELVPEWQYRMMPNN